MAASQQQVESLRAQVADAQRERCAGEVRLQQQAATYQQEVAGLGAEAAQLARKTSEAEQRLQEQLAMLKEEVSQQTGELVAARAAAADAHEQHLGSQDALRLSEAAHQDQMAAVHATQHQQLRGWQQVLEQREAAYQREVALLQDRIWEVTGAGILAAQQQRHRSDQWEAAALRKQSAQLRAAFQAELRTTQRSLEVAADTRLQRQAAEHQQQVREHLAAVEEQRQQQKAAYSSHLADAQTKLTRLLGQAAQEQVAELQQVLSPLKAELQRQTQRADLNAFEAATQQALRREAAQTAVLPQEGPDRRPAPPLLLVCGPLDVEMMKADGSPVPSPPAGPQSPRHCRSGAVPSGPASTTAAVLPHQGTLALATSTQPDPEQQQHADSLELDGAASLPAALMPTQRRPSYLASRGAGVPPGAGTGSRSLLPTGTASGQPLQQSQHGAGSLQGQALVLPASTTPAGGPHAGAANSSPAAPSSSGMRLPPSYVSLSGISTFSGRSGYTGAPRAGQGGSRLRGASGQLQRPIDILATACSLASGSEPSQAPQSCTPTSPALRPCAVVGFGSMEPLEPQRMAEPANSPPVQSSVAAPAEAGLGAGQRAGSQAAEVEPSSAPLSSEPLMQGSLFSQQATSGQGGARVKTGFKITLKRSSRKSQPDSPQDVSQANTAQGCSCDLHASCPPAQTGASSCTLQASAAPGEPTILGQP